MRWKALFSFLFLLFFTSFVFAGTTGKITGIVIDRDTKQPLPGANVIIEGTNMGAAADMKGNYIIINVPPGIYTVKAMMIGYGAMRVTNVRVSVNLTTTVNFELSTTVLDMGKEVTVVAERKSRKCRWKIFIKYLNCKQG